MSAVREVRTKMTSLKKTLKHLYPTWDYEYLVSWEGYDSDADSWEPESHLTGSEARLMLENLKANKKKWGTWPALPLAVVDNLHLD